MEGMTVGSVTNISCTEGYYMDDYVSLDCHSTGVWSAAIPDCHGNISEINISISQKVTNY